MKNNELPHRDTLRLVRDSWATVVSMGPKVTKRFYTNLFSLDPKLKSLFLSDMEGQENKLLRMIDVVIGELDDPHRLIPVLQQLGCRHVAYGVESAHYETVGASLFLTLTQSLGEDYTDPVRDAWTGVYAWMAEVMKEAAYSDV